MIRFKMHTQTLLWHNVTNHLGVEKCKIETNKEHAGREGGREKAIKCKGADPLT